MKKRFNSVILLFFAIIFMLSTITPALANQQQTPDISPWALETLNDGEKYGIFPVEWYYDGFQAEISKERLETLLSLTSEKIASLGLNKNENYQPIHYKGGNSRGEIITQLFNIAAQYDLPVGDSPVDYMKERGILVGTDSGLDLEKSATTEQAVIFATRFVKDTYHYVDAGGKGVAWKVENDGNIVYLLGSIHLGISDLYPFNQKLLEAYNESDALLVEANIFYDEEGMAYAVEKQLFQDGKTLKDVVSEETFAKVEQAAEKLNLPIEELIQQKPWTLASSLSMIELSNTFDIPPEQMAYQGIDMYFLTKAMLEQKPIIELEGIKAQIDMFEGLSLEAQEQYLVEALDAILAEDGNDESELIAEWLENWRTGDIESFKESMTAVEGEPTEFNQMLFGTRDEKMASKISELLKGEEKGTYFVVVGAGHFLTDKSVRYHLEQEGFKVVPFYQ